jgi:hypothetical protein
MKLLASGALLITAFALLPAAQATAGPVHRTAAHPSPMKCSPAKGRKVIWHGGPVSISDQVRIVYWGSWWRHHGGRVKSELRHLLGGGLGATRWARTLTQYCQNGQRPLWPASNLQSRPPVIDTANKLPAAPTRAQMGTVALWGRGIGVSAAPIVIIVTPPGSIPVDDTKLHECGEHRAVSFVVNGRHFGEPWIDIPVGLMEKGKGCFPALGLGLPAVLSIAAGHEWAETVTDPFPDGRGSFGEAWATKGSKVLHQQIADLCAPGLSPHNVITVKLKAGSFQMQKLWSNAAGKCVSSS